MKRPDSLLIARIGLALVQALPPRDGGHVVLITSAQPREGKTFVAHQLTTVLARTTESDMALISATAGQAIVDAVDPDARSNRGLAGLIEHGRLSDVAFRAEGQSPTVYQVPSGDAIQDDALFRTAGVVRAFAALRQRFALSLIDGPTLVACGAMLSEADAVVLVVDSRHTSPHSIRREIARAGIEPSRLSGVVLNQVPRGLPAWMGGD